LIKWKIRISLKPQIKLEPQNRIYAMRIDVAIPVGIKQQATVAFGFYYLAWEIQ
jgi:hypothetical protein